MSAVAYAIFAGHRYYPCGGMQDLTTVMSDESEARRTFESRKAAGMHDWLQLVRVATNPPEFTLVEEWENR